MSDYIKCPKCQVEINIKPLRIFMKLNQLRQFLILCHKCDHRFIYKMEGVEE